MSKLAVIGTFYKRYEATVPLLNRVLNESTRPPDLFWMMCESEEDAKSARQWERFYGNLHIEVLPTPTNSDGTYSVIPYSNKINWALDQSQEDYIVYLDNGSMPDIHKYEIMANELDNNPTYGAVYCTQLRTGYKEKTAVAESILEDAYCVTNYTQVMHKRTEDRWTLDMSHAVPNDLADAIFWRRLHARLGPLYPVGKGLILDTHHMESIKAAGL